MVKSKLYTLVAVLLIGSFAVQAVRDASENSVTWDETMYIGVGRYVAMTGTFDFANISALQSQPIFPSFLNSALLMFAPLPRSTLVIPPAGPGKAGTYIGDTAPNLLFRSGFDPQAILLLSRLPVILQSCFLAWLVLDLGTRLFGRRSGILALACLAFMPTFIAHSAIVHTDASVTVWLFATMYYYWKYLSHPSPRALLIVGVVTGLCALSKLNGGILALGTLISIYISHRLLVRRPMSQNADGQTSVVDRTVPPPRHLAQVIAIVVVMWWGAYGFGLAKSYLPPTHQDAGHRMVLPNSGISKLTRALHNDASARFPLVPFVYICEMVSNAQAWNWSGYLFGEIRPHGFRWYYPVAFVLKTPLPFLILTIVVCLGWKRLPKAELPAEVGMIVTVLLTFLLLVPEVSNVGVRYALPVYPFLCLWVSRLADCTDLGPIGLRLMRLGMPLLLLWHAVEGMWSCPNHLSYFNTLFNDPAKKYRYLVDSNLDWGQSLVELRDYVQAHKIPLTKDRVPWFHLSYFGSVDPMEYGIYSYGATGNSIGYVAISATHLAGAYLRNPDEFESFRHEKPIAIFGDGAMLLYYRAPPD